MAYVPTYESILDSASCTTNPITISNNTVDNFKQNAKDNGVNVIEDENGHVIGYSTNVSQVSYEGGEYIERTVQVPLYPHYNENSTEDNIIIDYKPYEAYESTDGTKYDAGAATFVIDKDDYLDSVLAANGIEIDRSVIDTTILDELWEHYKDDVLYEGSVVDNPVYRAIFGELAIDTPNFLLPDKVALDRMRLSDFAMKYLGSEDGIAKILKAAASVGLFTVGEVIEDDPETRQYFRYEAQVNDQIILKSPLGPNSGNRFDDKWYGCFIRPMLYCALGYPNHTYPTDADFDTYRWYQNNELVAKIYDDQVYAYNGKHCNIWLCNFQRYVADGSGYQADTRFYGFYAPQDSPTAKINSIDRIHGFAVVGFQNIFYPGGQYDWGAMKFSAWYERSGGSYFRATAANRPPTGAVLVFAYEDFMAYLSELMQTDFNTYWQFLGNMFVFADCTKASSIPGVKKNDNALRITANSTIAEIKQQIPIQYPEWHDKTVVQNEYNIYNNTTNPVTYYPIGIGQPKNQQSVIQAGTPTREVVEKNVTNNYTYNYNQVPNNPDTLPSHDNPHGIMTSNDFWTVYSPTPAQLSELGAKLWSQNFIDLLKQTFVNPTDGIISLMQIYLKPTATKQCQIHMGSYNTNVYANVVEKFVEEIDCELITVPRFYNDVRDYTETRVSIYLPFIGIEELDPRDVIGLTIRLRYRIDMLTGTCVAYISPRKQEINQSLENDNISYLSSCTYMFTGNCAVQLPITAADRSRLLSGVAIGVGGGAKVGSKLGGVGGGVAGGILGGVIGGLKGIQSEVYRSNGIQSNAGALAFTMIPYVIVQRQKPYDAYNYPMYYGKPQNATIALANCQGYTRVKDVILNTVNASEYEKNLIDRLLKEGIII